MGKKKAFTKFGIYLLIAFGFALFYFFNFKTVVVSGDSMLPTLKSGQKILISKAYWLIGGIRNGDIVVLHDNVPGEGEDTYIIKRVYRSAGQVVDYPNVPENHPFSAGEYRVPEDHLYIIGDNRDASEDSRKFGPVESGRVIGKLVARW